MKDFIKKGNENNHTVVEKSKIRKPNVYLRIYELIGKLYPIIYCSYVENI